MDWFLPSFLSYQITHQEIWRLNKLQGCENIYQCGKAGQSWHVREKKKTDQCSSCKVNQFSSPSPHCLTVHLLCWISVPLSPKTGQSVRESPACDRGHTPSGGEGMVRVYSQIMSAKNGGVQTRPSLLYEPLSLFPQPSSPLCQPMSAFAQPPSLFRVSHI